MALHSHQRTGGHVVVEALASAGTRSLFTIHGVQIEPIFQACVDLELALVDVRHEASAGFAAESYARISGNVGVAAVCPGPGFTNVLTSIANAYTDRTPVVYIVGSPPASLHESNGLQVGIDHVAIAAPITKWACRVLNSQQLGRLVAQAIRIATTAPYGPVLLDVPADVLSGPAGFEPPTGAPQLSSPGLTDGDADRCLELLASAKRPVIAVGHAMSTAGRAALRELIESTQIPFFGEYGTIGTFADDHPCNGGTLYQLGRLAEGAKPDVLLAIGLRFGYDTPGLRDGGVAWQTSVIHIDGDPGEIGRFANPIIGLVADTNQAIQQLARRSPQFAWAVPQDWRNTVSGERAHTREALDAIPPTDGNRVHPYAASRVISDVVASTGAILIGDGAVCKHWLHDALQLPSDATYLTHGRFGCMGAGTGMAIGAAFSNTGRPIVCVTGDGAIGFSIGEFEAIVRHGLPVTVVVMNNARWGASQGFQMRPGGPQRIVGTTLSDANYHDVMTSFGGDGHRVASLEDLRRVFSDSVASRRATCINVSTNSIGLAPEIPQLNA